MIPAASYWQAILLIAILVISAEVFLFDLSMPEYFRKVRLNWVNALLCVFVLTAAINVLGLIVQTTVTLYVFGTVSMLSLFAALFIMIWLVPTEKEDYLLREEIKDEEDVRNEELTKQKDGKTRKSLRRHKTITSKMICSIVIFLLPVILLVHVHKNNGFYFSNLKLYETFLAKDLPAGTYTWSHQSASALAQYLDTINLHFINTPKLQCAQSDTGCASVRNLLQSVQDNRSIFVGKVCYYFLLLYLVLRYYGKVVQIHYNRRPKDPDSLGLQNDVIEQCSEIISVSTAFLAALVFAGVDFTSLGLFGGLIGAGLSIALRDLLGNVVAGVLLLWDRTIKKDDVITVSPSPNADTGSTYAIVRKMTLRYTVVQDRNDVRRLIPNSYLTNNIVENWTHEDKMVRLRVHVGVDYNTDLRLARTLLEATCYEVTRIETKKNPPKAVVTGFGDHSINFALRFYIKDAEKGIRPVISDLYIGIYERFKKEGIKIPYPRRDLHIVVPDNDQDSSESGLASFEGTVTA